MQRFWLAEDGWVREDLAKYHFQDTLAQVMEEIAQAMIASELELDLEEMDDWFNRHNAPATIPAWYERAEGYISDHRLVTA